MRLEESSRVTVKTPWDVINDITDGGLGPGELGVVVVTLVLVSLGHYKTWF